MEMCQICSKEGLSLYFANHKDLGGVKLCPECWREAYAKNRLVWGSGSSGGCSCR